MFDDNYNDTFFINFDNVVKWLGQRKDSTKRTLVDNFIKIEEENSKYFTSLNQILLEIDNLSTQLDLTKTEIEKFINKKEFGK